MTKLTSKATPIGITLNIILLINVVIVLYPVLFTISSSFTKSNSLAATSIIPFTTQVDKEIRDDCQECMGTGYIPQTGMEYIKVETTFDENLNEIDSTGPEDKVCPECLGSGKGNNTKVVHKFSFKKPTIYQYRRLLTSPDKLVKGETTVHGTNYKIWYLNTLKIAVMNTIITVFICTLAGYIFSRFEFTGRKQIMGGLIVLQMFPSFIGMVATYVILWKFNALNTLWGLVLVYSAGSIPFNSQLMKGYFDTMSKDIAEAAYIDGASPLVAFIKVILPSAQPQLVFLALTSFTGPWMDYIFPRMILRSDDKKTLAVGLYEMISGRSNDNFTMFAAGAILVAVPFTILFMAGQKTLLMSMAGTSGKE
ncbi:MAG: ABC transporter permease subunit [Spirochaetia bacterium]|nr:ABC transporter permease subunit [Spirochaetia bacterium]MDY2824274.1 ABC transporter permease subunit [Treponema sp.]MCI6365309.1 ABC transporter permease subunit [Spirochaetia bacterium]MCI6546671.1 ABC transporter permease subunit [Spirochaetia bacterium]MCI7436740.1 ABC transporter permease subunit [Spirochaetia bacterium]